MTILFKKYFGFPILLYLAFAIIALIIYGKTLFFGFVYLDDNVWILDYQWYLKDMSNAIDLLSQPDLISKVFFRPILNLSFFMNAQMGGAELFSYRLTNILFHIINTCLIFHLFQRLGYDEKKSFWTALLIEVHPVLTSAVAWVPGRTDSLLAIWVLSSMICFLKSIQLEKLRYYVLHLVFIFLGLLTKETAIAIPLVASFYFWFVFENRRRRLFLPFIVGWGGVGLVWFLLRRLALQQYSHILPGVAFDSFFHNLPAIISYLGKIVFPVNLSVLPVLEDLVLKWGVLAFFILGSLILASKYMRVSYVMFGGFWFLVFLLPSLVASFLKHEYRLYLSMIGFFIVMWEIDFFRTIKKQQVIVLSLVAIIFAGILFVYSGQYKDRMMFWTNAVTHSPHSPLAHRNLGAMYHLDGNIEKAAEEYKVALKLNPKENMVHNNLGIIYMRQKLYAQAEKEYKAEIRDNPSYDNVYFNLGVLYSRQQHYDKAITFWKKTLQLNPKYVEAYENLTKVFIYKKDFSQAAVYIHELIRRGIPISDQYQSIYQAYYKN